MNTAARTADLVSVGSIVKYEDAANLPALYVVVSVDRTDPWSPFVLRSIDPDTGFSYKTSDLRQTGWAMVSA